MRPCFSWIPLLTLTVTQAVPQTASAWVMAPTPGLSPAEARAEQAAELYGQRKFLEAAQILEDLWATEQTPRDLFNAGLARMVLGHLSHAIRYWEIYLDLPNLPEEGREQAQAKLKKAQAAAIAVNLRLSPLAVSEVGVKYTLQRVATDPSDRRPPLVIELPPRASQFTLGGHTVYLDPGRWELRVEARGYRTGVHELTLRPGQTGFPKEIVLGPDPLMRHASFQVEPPEAVAAGATITLQRLSLAAQPQPCPLTEAGMCSVTLEPGDWEFVVQAPGFQRHTQMISLGADPSANFVVALAPTVDSAPLVVPASTATEVSGEPPPDTAETPEAPPVPEIVPRAVRVKLSTGLVAAGIPIFIGGLALGVIGSNNYQDRRLASTRPGDLLPPIHLRSTGMGLVGVAVGMWTTGLTAEYDVKPVVWYSELGVGAAFVTAGAIWAGVSSRKWNQDRVHEFRCSNSDGVDCFASHRMGASFFLGAGAGLVFGSALGLLLQHKHRKTPASTSKLQLGPFFAAGASGLAAHGRF